MSTPKSLLDHIEEVLGTADRPLSSKEILDLLSRQYGVQVGGDPIKTINARLTEEIRSNSSQSRFMRVEPGVYTLRRFTQFSEYIPDPIERTFSAEYEDQVLVFQRKDLDRLGYFHGVRQDHEEFLKRLFDASSDEALVSWKSRFDAENDFEHKQIVVYAIIQSGDSILRMSRGRWTSLRDNLGEYSIGIGGHVEIRDADLLADIRANDFRSICDQCIRREVSEEIGIDLEGAGDPEILGLLNDDSVEQGEQHFAIVYHMNLPNTEVSKKERWIKAPRFIPIDRVVDELHRYEYWSQLCIQVFWGDRLKLPCRVQPRPDFRLRNQKELLLVTGYVGSGKSEACDLLQERFGFTSVRCSRIMQELIGCGPIEEIGRDGLQQAGYRFIMEQDGHNRLASAIAELIAGNPSKHYALDGLRYPETLWALSNMVEKPITIVYIDTTIENLFSNYRDRHEKELSFDEFRQLISHPVEKAVQRFRPISDLTVHNNSTLASYTDVLTEFFRNELEGEVG